MRFISYIQYEYAIYPKFDMIQLKIRHRYQWLFLQSKTWYCTFENLINPVKNWTKFLNIYLKFDIYSNCLQHSNKKYPKDSSRIKYLLY